jgi:predicted DsbA family dithiol-disulfide isomerase
MPEMIDIAVDVVSDVVCPWCFIGKKRLEKAIAAVPDINVTVRWRPYQLDPSIPPEGLDRRAYMAAKFGSEERVRAAHEKLLPLGMAEGIAFDFDAIKVSPNTLDAHRMVRWAADGDSGAQGELVGRLFSLYFEHGRDIGDHAVLAKAAAESGLDAPALEALLDTDADREAVRQEIAVAAQMGITGVPCFLIENKYAVMGAQDSATLADAIRQIAQAKAKGELGTA